MPRSRKTLAAQFQVFARNLSPSVLSSLMAPADGQQRLVTALFIGMTRPASAGAARNLFETMFGALSRYDGRIDRFLGDGALAMFGTPRMHEDDPERAILCALELRTAALKRGLEAASGISTGQVSPGLMDPDEHHESGVMGPVATLARRLQSAAKAGEIIVDEFTHRQAHRSFEFTALEGSVPAWRVERRLPRFEKVRGLDGMNAPLVGRDDELARLRDAYVMAAGGTGRVVAIVGEAGLGKSRLVAELKDRALDGPDKSPRPLWLEGRCPETGITTAYRSFIDMLGQHFHHELQAGESGRASRVAETLETLQASGSLSAERVEEIGPLLGRFLSIRFGTGWDVALEHARAEQIRHQTLRAIRDLLLAFARQRPVVAVLDDLHWADPLSMDVIELLMESIDTASILLVCLYRPERGARCSQLPAIAARACPGRFSEVVLQKLDPSQGHRLIRSLLAGGGLSHAISDSILERSQGNPFFIEELIRSLIDSGAVRRDAGRWEVREDAVAATVPRTLQGVILSRVDRLDPASRRLLEGAAVIGASFDRRVLELVAAGEGDLASALDMLERRSLVVGSGAAAGAHYSFKHVLTQQAVYQGIHRLRRDRLHGRAAAAIESLFGDSLDAYSESLAFHYEQAGDTEHAVGSLLKAGRKARNAYHNDAAVRHFHHARELLDGARVPPGRSRLDVLSAMGTQYDAMGMLAQAEAAFREASDLARCLGCTPRERARILMSLCQVVSDRHRADETLPIGEEIRDLLGSDTECLEAVYADMVFAHTAFDLGDHLPHCDVARRRGGLIRSLPYTPIIADYCAFLPLPLSLDKREAEALDWLEWIEREALRRSDLTTLAATHVRRGRDILAPRGDLPGAVEEMARALELYDRIGARYLEARCHLFTGDLHYRFGRLEPAHESLRRAQALLELLQRHPHVKAETALLEGQLAMCRGDASAALAAFQGALAAAPGKQWEWFLRLLMGCTLLDQGRKKEAAAQFLMVLDATLTFRVPPAYAATVDLASLLSLIESCDDGAEEFRATCALVQRKRPEARAVLSQWYLEPAEPRGLMHAGATDAAAWTWHDPCGDSMREDDSGIVIAAMPGRGLGGVNFSAPRLVRCASGDFALQATVGPADKDMPAVGGLVFWKSDHDYLRLDRGSLAPRSVSLRGCVGDKDITIGRGRLRTESVTLRLERSGSSVRALCSADGHEWFSVGEAAFPGDDSLEVGLFADGASRPEVYPTRYVGGSRIRYSDIWVSG